MTLEQLFPILMQYAPAMMNAIQNRGYDPGVMLQNANNIFTDSIGGTPTLDGLIKKIYRYTQYSDYPDDLGQSLNSIDEVFNQYLKDSDNPNNEKASIIKNDSDDILIHDPEYTLDELTSNPPGEYMSSFITGPGSSSLSIFPYDDDDDPPHIPDRPNALGHALNMIDAGMFSRNINPNMIERSVKDPNTLIQFYNKLNKGTY